MQMQIILQKYFFVVKGQFMRFFTWEHKYATFRFFPQLIIFLWENDSGKKSVMETDAIMTLHCQKLCL